MTKAAREPSHVSKYSKWKEAKTDQMEMIHFKGLIIPPAHEVTPRARNCIDREKKKNKTRAQVSNFRLELQQKIQALWRQRKLHPGILLLVRCHKRKQKEASAFR